MKAELKEIYSIEVPDSLKDYRPRDQRNFGISVRLMIGPEGTQASESFDVFVCTPTWLQERLLEERGCEWGRHMLFTPEYDLERILKFVSLYISSCTGKDWEEIAKKIAQVAAWEFDDYLPRN